MIAPMRGPVSIRVILSRRISGPMELHAGIPPGKPSRLLAVCLDLPTFPLKSPQMSIGVSEKSSVNS